MLPVYLQVYQTRIIDPRSRYYQLIQHDMRLAASFYYKIYERRFSGRMEGVSRLPLIRENSILGPLRYIDEQHKAIRNTPEFRRVFGAYAIGDTEAVNERNNGALVDLPTERALAWYLLRHSVPCISHLVALRELARESFEQLAITRPSSDGSTHRTQSEWPVIVRTRWLEVRYQLHTPIFAKQTATHVEATSNIRIVLSRLALMIC